MPTALSWISGVFLGAITLIALSFFVSSIWERERRASTLGGLLFAALAMLTTAFFILSSGGFFDQGAGMWALMIWVAVCIIGMVLLTLRIGANPAAFKGTRGLIVGEVDRWDERYAVFSVLKELRATRLTDDANADKSATRTDNNTDGIKSSDLLQYQQSGERLSDDRMNSLDSEFLAASSLPIKGLIDGPGGAVLDKMACASSITTKHLAAAKILRPAVSPTRHEMSPAEAAMRIKGFARHLGAVLVGITEVDPVWLYSHRGISGVDQREWGEKIAGGHKYAIVFAEEMDVDIVATSPHTPAVVETMVNYAKGGFIAAQLAAFIAQLGYSAKADQMEHYDALMVPLAIDAGLGELSRMGYLITKDYGPRVRLNIVSTDLPLDCDSPVDIGVLDFCRICKKCASCCPSGSIPPGEREEVNGSLRWKLNAESCLGYWQEVGTDCAICMRVCPWSHARTFPHRLITELVSKNALSRRLFNWMDDLFYGKNPPPKVPPEWASFDFKQGES